jgi:hypothetical protein
MSLTKYYDNLLDIKLRRARHTLIKAEYPSSKNKSMHIKTISKGRSIEKNVKSHCKA